MKRNTTTIERILRLGGGAVIAVYAFTQLTFPLSLGVAAVGIVFALTGLVGFCPMCYVAGRKPVE